MTSIGLFNVAFYTVRSGIATVALPLVASVRFALGPAEIGILQALVLVLNLSAIVGTGRWITERNMRQALFLSIATMVVGLATFVYAATVPVLILALSIFALGSGIGLPVPPLHAAAHSDTGARGLGVGTFRLSSDLGLGPVSASFTLGADPTGVLFGVTGGAAILVHSSCLALALPVPGRRHHLSPAIL